MNGAQAMKNEMEWITNRSLLLRQSNRWRETERERERETEGKSSFKVTEYFLYIRISVNLLKRPIC